MEQKPEYYGPALMGEIKKEPFPLTSQSIGELATALSKCQGAIKGAKKDSSNPFYQSSYADLSSVWDACREPLSQNDLAITQTSEIGQNGELVLITTLMHKSGEWIRGRLNMKPTKSDPQGYGSCLTYMRRYSLAAMVGIAPEDDDGEAAMDRDAKKTQHEKPKPVPQKTPPPRTPPAKTSPPKTSSSEIDMLNKTDLPFKADEIFQAFKKQKERVGEKPYYTVLGAAGYEHANELPNRKTKILVYEELKQLPTIIDTATNQPIQLSSNTFDIDKIPF